MDLFLKNIGVGQIEAKPVAGIIKAYMHFQATANNLRYGFDVHDAESRFSVSVVVPVRNEESNISVTIHSLLGQSLTAEEIIIVDGGSHDKTREIIREYMNDEDPLRLIEDPDAYPGRARNLGIDRATTEWIAMTDAGTIIGSDWLANLVREANSLEGADVVLGSYDPLLGSFFKECLALAFVAPAARVEDGWLRGPSTASLMIKKSVWHELGEFPEHLRACEDLLFFEHLADSKHKIAVAPEAVVSWRIPDSFGAIFRRFRAYSLHTLNAGLGKRWHFAIAKMYLLGLIFVGLAAIHHPAWLLVPGLGLALRSYRSISKRRPSLKLAHGVGPHTYGSVAAILLWIDTAALFGAADYIFFRGRDRGKR